MLATRPAGDDVRATERRALAPRRVIPGVRSGVGVPMRWNGELRGALSSASATSARSAREDLHVLEAIADLAVVACHNAEAYDDVRTAASTDALTGLLNHGAMQVRVREEIARAARDGQPLCCVLIDLDDFKRVNDELGHPAGDALLRRVADALRAEVRPYDQVARYGGDEFVLVLPGTDESDGARGRRARARRASARASRAAPTARSATARSASPRGSRRWTPTSCSPPPTARCCWPSAPARAASPSRTRTPRRSWPGCSGADALAGRRAGARRRDRGARQLHAGHSEQVVGLATGVAMLLGLTADAVERDRPRRAAARRRQARDPARDPAQGRRARRRRVAT